MDGTAKADSLLTPIVDLKQDFINSSFEKLPSPLEIEIATRGIAFLPRKSINSFYIVGESYVVVHFSKSSVLANCSVMTVQ